MPYLFSSESVSEGHPDKISDQISDALVDYFLAFDPDSKVACETLVTTGQVFLAGEVNTQVYLDLEQIARDVINDIGYTKESYKFNGDSCGVLSAIHGQSPDINRGVDKGSDSKDFETLAKLQGAGDQGMMFGYANTETEDLIPLPLYLAHLLMKELADIRKEGKEMTYLRPDSKSQVTIEYSDDHKPLKIDTIVISTQHDEFDADEDKMQAEIRKDVQEILIPRVIAKLPEETQKLFADTYKLHVNPTGKFVIGGPHGDTGLTGRKIIVDTYGGRGAHGGGAFSGKDPSKVDRSGAYAARHIAKNLVAAGVADEVLVQVSYAIGRPEPCNLYIDTFNRSHVDMSDGEIAEKVEDLFDLRPYAIEQNLKLRNPIYRATATYGHMGRKPYKKDLTIAHGKHRKEFKDLEFFTWEKLDRVDDIKKAFNL